VGARKIKHKAGTRTKGQREWEVYPPPPHVPFRGEAEIIERPKGQE